MVACALIIACALPGGGGEVARKLHKFCTGIGRYAGAGRCDIALLLQFERGKEVLDVTEVGLLLVRLVAFHSLHLLRRD